MHRPLPSLPRRRTVRIALLAIATSFAIASATASPALGYYIEGRGWPGPTITYYAGVYPRAVDRAAAVWNRVGLGVTLQRTSKNTARVIISSGPRGCAGRARVGYAGSDRSS